MLFSRVLSMMSGWCTVFANSMPQPNEVADQMDKSLIIRSPFMGNNLPQFSGSV